MLWLNSKLWLTFALPTPFLANTRRIDIGQKYLVPSRWRAIINVTNDICALNFTPHLPDCETR